MRLLFQEVRDPAAFRSFLEKDPLRFSSMINKLFYDTVWSQKLSFKLYVGNLTDPKEFILKEQAEGEQIEFRVSDKTAEDYIDQMPAEGFAEFGNIERNVYDLVKMNFDLEMDEPCVEVLLDPADFKPNIDMDIIRLNKQDADTIDRHWGLVPDFAWYFKQRILESTTVGVRHNGELIGWMGTYWETDKFAQLGYLHVKGEHRRGGLAYSLVSAICQDIIDRNKTPVAHAFDTNTASLALAEKIGFKQIGEKFWAKGRKRA